MKDYWRVASVLEAQHGVATRAQLLAAGVTRQELTTAVTAGLFVRVQPNVYRLRGSQPSTEQLLLAACLSAGAAASHRSAAALWNLPAPRPSKPRADRCQRPKRNRRAASDSGEPGSRRGWCRGSVEPGPTTV